MALFATLREKSFFRRPCRTLWCRTSCIESAGQIATSGASHAGICLSWRNGSIKRF